MSNLGWIYAITCMVNSKVYVGSTANKRGPSARFIRHKWELYTGVHSNSQLQRCFNKYGLESLKFDIIDTVPIDLLLQTEQRYLDNTEFAMNTCKVTGTTRGIKHPPRTVETRQKLSVALIGRTTGRKGIPLSQETKEKIRKTKTGRRFGPHSAERRDKIRKAQPYSRSVIDQNGVIYPSQKAAAKALNLNIGSISRNVRGLITNTKGFKFKYV